MPKILEANTFVTTDKHSAVKIRMGDGAASAAPLSIPELLARSAAEAGDGVALAVKRNGEWLRWTYREYLAEVRTVAKAFVKLGLEPRKTVGIVGFNSPEWFVADVAAVFAGGIACGIYATNSAEACQFIADDSETNILVVEDEKQVDKMMTVRAELKDVKAIVQYTGEPTRDGVLSWKQLLEIGQNESEEELEQRLAGVAVNQCCHLVYTSGTTGDPKGVMLSHDNITFTARCIMETFGVRENVETYVSYLPLSHVAANVTDIFHMMTAKASVYFADKDALKGSLTTTLKEVKPTLFLAVPRVWEKIHERMLAIGAANKGWKRQLGTWAKRTGYEHNLRLLENNENAGGSSIAYTLAKKLVFQKIKDALGLGNCRVFGSAAAPLSKTVLDYFLSIDIRIFEIYGMSECTGPNLCNTFGKQKLYSVGKTMDGFHTKLDAEKGGEILFRSRNVMMGYLGLEEKTREAFDEDGWLRSGDLGRQDEDGFTFMTGRIKEILITAGGENVAPLPIEERLAKALPVVSNVMLIGDQRKFLSCLVTLKVEVDADTGVPSDDLSEVALAWCAEVGSKARTVTDAAKDDSVRKAVGDALAEVNAAAISNAQKVQKFTIVEREFSLPGGELGPTLKMKRHVIADMYREEIDAMYK